MEIKLHLKMEQSLAEFLYFAPTSYYMATSLVCTELLRKFDKRVLSL